MGSSHVEKTPYMWRRPHITYPLNIPNIPVAKTHYIGLTYTGSLVLLGRSINFFYNTEFLTRSGLLSKRILNVLW